MQKTHNMKKIAVIGGNGQLGNCIRKISQDFENRYDFIFTDSKTLDITDKDQIDDFFYDNKPEILHQCICIYCSRFSRKRRRKGFCSKCRRCRELGGSL